MPRRYKRTLDHQGHRHGGQAGVGRQLSACPYSNAPTKRAMANLTIDRKVILCCKPSINDAAL